MFFSNLVVYKFKTDLPLNYTQAGLEEALSQDKFRPCGNQELQTVGWTKAFGKHGETLAQFSDEYILLCARTEQKSMPARALNELVESRVAVIEVEEGRTVKKREKSEIKENVFFSMLESAFSYSTYQFGFIDMSRGLLVVNTSSFNKAEEFAALLRKSIGTLPIMPAFNDIDLDFHLTSWLTDFKAPKNFEIGGDVELEDALDSGSQIKFKGYDLSCDEVKSHLEGYKRVTKLSLDWGERLGFTLESSGLIKRVKFSDGIKEENADIPSEDMAVKLDADFLLCAVEMTDLIGELLLINDGKEADA